MELIKEMDENYKLMFEDNYDPNMDAMMAKMLSNNVSHIDTWFPEHRDCICEGYHNRCPKAPVELCRFDLECTKPTCHYYHSDGRIPKLDVERTKAPNAPIKLCRFDLDCTKPTCHYSHSDGRIPMKVEEQKVLNTPNAPIKLCRFDLKCVKPNCHYSHSDGRVNETLQQKEVVH